MKLWFFCRITNDAREDEMEQNMSEVSGMLGNLRNMAIDMGSEISAQNNQLGRITSKVSSVFRYQKSFDRYIQYYVFKHKTLKWSKRIFFKMLEILKYNAYWLFLLSPKLTTSLHLQNLLSVFFIVYSMTLSDKIELGFLYINNCMSFL